MCTTKRELNTYYGDVTELNILNDLTDRQSINLLLDKLATQITSTISCIQAAICGQNCKEKNINCIYK